MHRDSNKIWINWKKSKMKYSILHYIAGYHIVSHYIIYKIIDHIIKLHSIISSYLWQHIILYHYDLYHIQYQIVTIYMSFTSLCTPKKRHQFCHIWAEKTSGHVRWVWGSTPGHEHGWLAVTSFFQLGLAADSFFKGKQRWKCPKGLQIPFLDPWGTIVYLPTFIRNINYSCR